MHVIMVKWHLSHLRFAKKTNAAKVLIKERLNYYNYRIGYGNCKQE